MVRVGVSIYLMFVTLAGPLLCPCSTSSWYTSTASTDTNAPPRVARSCPCCPRPTTASREHPRGGEQPAPAQTPCSCPSHGHRVVAFPPQRVQHITQDAGGTLDGVHLGLLFCWADLAWLAQGAASPRPSDRLFLDPQDLLRVFHILRC